MSDIILHIKNMKGIETTVSTWLI